MSQHFNVVVVGGGTAGLSVAARLRNSDNPPTVAIIEPSKTHYYQPIWTLVGGGVFDKEISARPEADYIPPGATWIQDSVESFDPDNKAVVLAKGEPVTYDQLVVAAGIQLDWDKVDGLTDTLGKNGVTSNYSYDTVEYTWECIRNLKSGKALFTFPATPIKCAGAPQKIMYLAEHHFRRTGVRRNIEVKYGCAGGAIFGVAKYRAALEKIVEERDIKTAFKHSLVAVDGAKKIATFENLDGGEKVEMGFDMIHVTPPMSAPDFIKQSPLASDKGWVDVDKHTTQHVRYPDVFSLGDCSSLPTSKTGAAIRKEAPVTAENLLAHRAGRPLHAKYDGYASCPLVTGYGTVILAEFDYNGNPVETFGFDQAKERYSMYALKAYGLPPMYWNGMLQGTM